MNQRYYKKQSLAVMLFGSECFEVSTHDLLSLHILTRNKRKKKKCGYDLSYRIHETKKYACKVYLALAKLKIH